jgi:hypothetical protein
LKNVITFKIGELRKILAPGELNVFAEPKLGSRAIKDVVVNDGDK